MRLADVGHVRARAAIVAVDGVVPPVPVRGERVHVVVAGAYGVTARAPVDVVGPPRASILSAPAILARVLCPSSPVILSSPVLPMPGTSTVSYK